MNGSAEPGARFEAIERLLAFDPGDRKIAALQAPGDLERCCRSLATARSATILTGFYITAAGSAETDGPPGAGDLAAALAAMGIPTTLLTDFNCARVVGAAWDDCLTWDGAGAAPAKAAGASHLIAIERPGRTATGKYYTMRGLDISAQVAPIDRLLLERPAGTTTIGVGDGGNEAGMGKAINSVAAHVPNGALIASVVPADFLVAAGTSNWGAWGIAAGLSLLA
ncbi:MAG TPA: glutamate cyclase domain-containing protein, partial [Planctomycetia bacterium]|nr:glutamate cyclase domain-containing protein [Planctomycetia bacterium]